MKVKISVEFLNSPGKDSRVYEVTRVPCVGEYVCIDDDSFLVKDVEHLLSASWKTDACAIVRVSR